MATTAGVGARQLHLAGLAANAGLLLLPPLLFSFALWGSLPPAYSFANFWKDIPPALVLGGNLTQAFVFALPVLMRSGVSSPRQRLGLKTYGVGLAAYYASYFAQIAFPDSAWSTSVVGFAAPAYTPLLWLAGIAMVADRLYVRRIPYRWWLYLLGSLAFVAFHTAHALLVFSRAF
jgi:hypothetical protein